MKTIQEMLQELSQCIVTVSGEFRFRTNWNGGKVPQPDLDVFDPNVPFCIENVGDVPVEVGLYNIGAYAIRSNCKISTNLKTWSDYNLVLTNDDTNNDIGRILLQNKGDRVYIKADKALIGMYPPSPYPHTRFKVFNPSENKKIRARGNIASLNHGDNDLYKTDYLTYPANDSYYYYSMFRDCSALTQAPELPATTLAKCCYYSMFSGCTSLVQAPELPATTLADYCYSYMFSGCRALTQAPTLPATTLADHCYLGMFQDCRALTQAPAELPATTLADSCYHSMFQDCRALTQAPELPATTLASSCYSYMFYDCRALTQAPELPATTLADYCYSYMFSGCRALTQAPTLPATTLADYCYYGMFSGCFALTQAPELPATTLASSCYSNMFQYCTSLVQAPELPATTLADYCYDDMFYGCTSLTQAPELPATTLAKYCYSGMFKNCRALTQAPELPATTLADYCYDDMFYGCNKLNYVKCLATDNSATDCTKDWLYNVSATGTFECDNKKYFAIDSPNGIPTGWTITEINPDPPTPPEPEKPDLDVFDPNVPFCIENVGDVPVEIGMYDVTSNIRNSCEISYNNKDWITYNLAVDPNPSDIKKITLSNKGDRVYIKSNHYGTTMSPTPYTRIKVLNESDTTKIQARGNIASLNYARNDEYKTKYNSTENSCYSGLFMSCKSLIKAPDLVATALSKSCYMSMFSGCTNLKYIKCLATNISASNCTNVWVSGVSSTGDFYAQATTIWTSGANGIPSGWTRHDIT